MTKKTALVILILISYGCGPDNKQVTNEQVETGVQEETLDSIATTEEDGVNTVEADTTDRQLP